MITPSTPRMHLPWTFRTTKSNNFPRRMHSQVNKLLLVSRFYIFYLLEVVEKWRWKNKYIFFFHYYYLCEYVWCALVFKGRGIVRKGKFFQETGDMSVVKTWMLNNNPNFNAWESSDSPKTTGIRKRFTLHPQAWGNKTPRHRTCQACQKRRITLDSTM